MSNTEKKEEKPLEKKVYAEARGKYTLVDGPKLCSFEFPSNSTLAQNYESITFLREQIWIAMENQKKIEDEAKKKETDEKESAQQVKEEEK